MMKIPILTYHSLDIAGNDYANNDLVAFADDIEQIVANGFRIRPLSRIVDDWLEAPQRLESAPVVALTCDDGSDFDFRDLPHPVAGNQRGILNILRDFHERPGRDPVAISATSFVIVSPGARRRLDQTCLIGKGWWNDDWWRPALATGLMEIGNHSWDHNHESLDEGDSPGVARGTFTTIATEELADYQIAQASDHLSRFAPNPARGLFAYPYGEMNEFLVKDYFPRRGSRLGIKAAFSDEAGPLHRDSNRWALPRYVCRRDWRSPSELRGILDDARR
jgi:peptidoglycan/xylan/chitin deacetylase (PgdA/CDA1 family)